MLRHCSHFVVTGQGRFVPSMALGFSMASCWPRYLRILVECVFRAAKVMLKVLIYHQLRNGFGVDLG
jgi:hypothetical protein